MTPSSPEPTSPVAIPDFRLLWVARFAAVMATTSMVVVIGWQVYDVARSAYGMSRSHAAFQLGLLGLFQFLPLFVLTPVAGWAADRFDRRFMAAFSYSTDIVVALSLGIATQTHSLSLPLLFGLAALHGTARVFSGPALSAMVPNVVPPSLLPKAIALASIAMQAASMLGPAAGGLLYAAHPALPYWIGSGLLALSMTCVLLIRPIRASGMRRDIHPVRQMAEGLGYVWNERFLLGCITLDLFAVLLAGATALLPVYARDILHVGPEGLGQMRAAPAVGAAIVALWLSFRPLERNVGVKMMWAVAVFGAATAVFGVSRSFLLSLAMLVLLGAADMVSVFVRNTLVQLNTPDDMRGRVSSVSGLTISASNELGEMQSGVAAAILGATGAVVFGGVGAIVVTAIWAVIFPELARARTFAPQFRQTSATEHETTEKEPAQ
ncbi:MFS transporter [Novosphingobium sp. ZN18A2]|uniref:MFS transporter n=1 Tax=Novosphingobium sp. ZN18A2 TaxID=3079861 RepID=UPI0030D08BE9